jgi:hypothetical protein
VTLFLCKALERAASAAIRSGREMIDRAALADEAIWKGISPSVMVPVLAAGGRQPAAGHA